MKTKIVITALLLSMLSSCNLYKKYESPKTDVSKLYGDTILTDTSSIADESWQKMFTDVHLQNLINKALTNNYGLRAALLNIEQAEASLRVSNGAYAPSLSFAPNGTISSFDGNVSKVYEIPLVASWQVPIFGGLLNSRRQAKMNVLQYQAAAQAVRSQVIASVANSYYFLLMLHKQAQILRSTITLWDKTVETMRAMKEIGQANEASVSQSEANCHAIRISLQETQLQIRQSENALSVLLGDAPHHIERGTIDNITSPLQVKTGVPLRVLSRRPDVREAESALASAYYATNIARSSFYPNLTLTGSFGWTNNAGSMIVNPAKILASATASLVAPIFSNGRNKANLRIAKARQQQALASFNQALVSAGGEVSDALAQYDAAKKKQSERKSQIDALQRSVSYTTELFHLGSSTYLEVLTAQQGLLTAQLSEVADKYAQLQSVVALYQALGGGAE